MGQEDGSLVPIFLIEFANGDVALRQINCSTELCFLGRVQKTSYLKNKSIRLNVVKRHCKYRKYLKRLEFVGEISSSLFMFLKHVYKSFKKEIGGHIYMAAFPQD